jgi:aryl-phospho-beta-D-glucosidase BglC (GH1 family)
MQPLRLMAATLAVATSLSVPAHAAGLIHFWDAPQHGANSFNEAPPNLAYFQALRATGATWVRLTPSKWKGVGRDFMIGDADHYNGLPASDLATLRKVVEAAGAAGLKVVIVPLSLPGDRWSQQNGGKDDARLWNDRAYWEQSADFWRDLAAALKDEPMIAGYNLINEPTPEKGMGLDEQAAPDVRQAWYAKYKGTAHDLPDFYETLIKAIRSVDPDTPVMVDGGWYANAWSFSYWPSKLSDDKVLYSFHMYEPYEATSGPNIKRDPQLRYPGVESWFGGEKVRWGKAVMARYLSGPFDWAAAHGVPNNRVVAGEFGCVREWVDCGTYLGDVLDVLKSHHAHWAFYGWREDGWDAMDYELAPSVTTGQFYYLREQGKADQLKRTPHPLLDIIEAHMVDD